MTDLAIPDPTPALDVDQLAAQVPAMLAAIELIDDIGYAEEMRARAAALEEYLARRGKDAGPAMTINRNIEARVGALLGPQEMTNGRPLPALVKVIHHARRNEFRLLNQYRKVWEEKPARPREEIIGAIKKHQAKVIDVEARAIESVTSGDVEGERWAMLAGTIQDRGMDIKSGSVDLIVTDPPYPAEMRHLWDDLAQLAARVLKHQAILVVLSGKIGLADVMARLSWQLSYGWVYCEPLPGSSTRILARHVTQTWKPWLAFSNGPWPSGRVDWHPDMVDEFPASKSRYRWEQAAGRARQLIGWLAPENGLILDPFAGVGSYGVAALDTDRRFIGIEADHDRYQTCCDRLAAT